MLSVTTVTFQLRVGKPTELEHHMGQPTRVSRLHILKVGNGKGILPQSALNGESLTFD